MLKNYLKVTLRTLRKQPGYSLINVGGLGLGLACAFMIVLYVQHELSFDRFNPDADRIYRLVLHNTSNGGSLLAYSAAGLTPLFKEQFPEIEEAVRYETREPYLKVDGRLRDAGTVAFMDENVFDVFGFELVRGDAKTALADPYSIVLTETGAQALFGNDDPMGRQIGYSDRFDLTVTGVMKDVPDNSHIDFDFLVPFALETEFMGDDALTDLTNWNYFTYLKLVPGSDPMALQERLDAAWLKQSGQTGPQTTHLALQPLTQIHLTTNIQFDKGRKTDPAYLYLFSGVALLVLVIACVNFMNLATARAAKRGKEVGVRKVVGANRRQIVGQFLGESLMMSVLAIVVAFVLVVVFLPQFNEAIGSHAVLAASHPGIIVLLIAIGLLAGLLAGTYPAFYLSSYRAARVLKGEAVRGTRAARLRQVLIVFQFAVSIFLIVGTLTIYKQLNHMQNQRLGFDQEHVVFLSMPAPIEDSYDVFRQQLLANPSIVQVARAGGLPGRVGTNRGYQWPGADGQNQGKSFYTIPGDAHYVEALGLHIVAGRDFSEDRETDGEDTYILNETAVKQLGWDDPVGHPFKAWDRPMGTVVGVVQDFHYEGLQKAIQPIVINMKPWYGMVAVRLAPGNVKATMDFIQQQWNHLAPEYDFLATFLDADFNRLYSDERHLGELFTFFAAIAIFVACLGLFGLAAFAAERRTKEIGVRKVMGASVSGIIMLLSREFSKLVLVAFVIAVPVAYFAMNSWLSDFAYRTDVGLGIFALAGVTAFVIAFLTVSYQSVKAATANPVKALRYE